MSDNANDTASKPPAQPVLAQLASDCVQLTVGALSLRGLVTQPYAQPLPSAQAPSAADAAAAPVSVANFRNVQYARIAGRWHEAEPVDLPATIGVWDCTKFGPRSPQSVDLMQEWSQHLYTHLAIYDTVSEFDCLNLNIYTPLATLQATAAAKDAAPALLPVLVWIHGGSFEWGDGGVTYGMRFSSFSSPPSSSFIFIFIFIFVCFFPHNAHPSRRPVPRQPLRVRRQAHCGRGPQLPPGNAGLLHVRGAPRGCALPRRGRLQQPGPARPAARLAMGEGPGSKCSRNTRSTHADSPPRPQVHKYIHLFGGDPSRITMAGESAGAISVLAHLRGNVPVARNALVMSPGSIGPVSFQAAGATFDKACATLGLGAAAPAEQLATLRRLPYEQLYALGAGRLETLLSEDPAFFADWTGQRFEEVKAFPAWIDQVVIGKMAEETAYMEGYWASLPPAEVIASWKAVYGSPDYADEVLGVYGLAGGAPGTDAAAAALTVAKAAVACTSDALFDKATYAPATTHLAAEDSQARVYLYRNDQADELAPGEPYRHHAYHSLDNAFVFQLPTVAGPDAPPRMRNAAVAFSGKVLDLVHGAVPWPPLQRAAPRQQAVFDGEGVHVEDAPPPRWVPLTSSDVRHDQFMKSTALLWSSIMGMATRVLAGKSADEAK